MIKLDYISTNKTKERVELGSKYRVYGFNEPLFDQLEVSTKGFIFLCDRCDADYIIASDAYCHYCINSSNHCRIINDLNGSDTDLNHLLKMIEYKSGGKLGIHSCDDSLSLTPSDDIELRKWCIDRVHDASSPTDSIWHAQRVYDWVTTSRVPDNTK